MKKKYLFIFFLLALAILLIASFRAKETNDWASENLNGKVKSITVFNYKGILRLGKLEKGEFGYPFKTIRNYNPQGNRIDETDYNNYQDVDNRLAYKYNKRGRRIEASQYNLGTTLSKRINYLYDAKGNQIQENICSYFDSGNLFTKATFKYNAFQSFWGNGNPIRFGFYEPDFNGSQTEINFYNENGSLSTRYTYEYDYKGNRVKQRFFEADGSLINYQTYKYDGNGNPTEVKSYKPDGKPEYSFRFEYVYDDKGNWIKKLAYGDVIPSYICERKIEYY